MKTTRASGSAPLAAPTAPSASVVAPALQSPDVIVGADTAKTVDQVLLSHAEPVLSSDAQTVEVRRKLLKLGLLTSLSSKTLETDTQKALLELQRAHNLAPTGTADAPTLAKLDELVAAKMAAFVPQPRHPFLQELLPAALEIEKTHGIPAAVVLAQAALESGYGKRAIGTYNIFGIKGRGSLGKLDVTTHEYVRGVKKKLKQPFAHFASYAEALKKHAEVFYNGNYSRALKQLNDPKKFALAIQGVYATDPRYARKLTTIMREQNLIPPDPKPAPKAPVKKPVARK